MRKTVKINISGLVFHIDEDAYEKLRTYLNTLDSRFIDYQEKQEIIADIESRIAELFQGYINEQKEVITVEDVEKVIGIMGNPEDIIDEEEQNNHYQHQESSSEYRTRSKRLYRDPDNAVLGGVSAGLGAYLNIDPILFRILFVIFFFGYGSSLLVYIILWIVLPPARTRAQKLEMRGENVNISNIERSIKDEYHVVRNNLSKVRHSRSYSRVGDFFEEIVRVFGVLILGIARALLVLIGLALVIGGFVALVSFIGIFVFNSVLLSGLFNIETFSVSSLVPFFAGPVNTELLMISLLCVVGIPLLAIVYGGIKLMFRFRARDRIIGVLGFAVWLIALFVLISMALVEGRNVATEGSYTQTKEVQFNHDTVFLSVSPEHEPGSAEIVVMNEHTHMVYSEDQERLLIRPAISIERSTSDELKVRMHNRARGANRYDAVEQARDIPYHWSVKDSAIELDPYFYIQQGETWHFQKVDIVVLVPEDMYVQLNDNLRYYLHNVYNRENMWDREMAGKLWQMTPDGLTLADDQD
ncbi:MAG TPA: PspC domain-containing protein [Bacteroidales bacterium]|nr:PspC domain-containing protein [Bacteroidales bacterium]